jgi:hypothetical protein
MIVVLPIIATCAKRTLLSLAVLCLLTDFHFANTERYRLRGATPCRTSLAHTIPLLPACLDPDSDLTLNTPRAF